MQEMKGYIVPIYTPLLYLLPSGRDLLSHFTMIAEAGDAIGMTPVAQPA